MRRCLTVAVLVLLAGAGVNVAVTWGCAWWGGDMRVTTDRGNAGGASWHLEYGANRVATLFMLEWHRPWHLYDDKPLPVAIFPRWARSIATPPFPPVTPARTAGRVAVAVGWPLRSMRYEAETVVVGSAVAAAVHEGLDVSSPPVPVAGILPLRPILGGFAGNSVLYSVAVLAVGLAFLGARRTIPDEARPLSCMRLPLRARPQVHRVRAAHDLAVRTSVMTPRAAVPRLRAHRRP